MTILLTGRIDSGKTSFLQALAAELGKGRVAGVLSPAPPVGGVKTRYFVRNARGGAWRPLLVRTEKGPRPIKTGFAYGNRVLARAARSRAALVFLDEFGPLELSGRGFGRAALRLARLHRPHLAVVVRKKLAGAAARALAPRRLRVFDLDRPATRARARRFLLSLA